MTHIRQRLNLEALEDRRLLATCHVVRLGDFGAGSDLGGGHSRGDLRYCINKANDLPGHDTIDINATGTINLTGPLPDLSTDMDILGPGGIMTVRRNTGGNYGIFTIGAGAEVRISALRVTNGYQTGAGGGIRNFGSLTLFDTDVTSNTATTLGGGIYNAGTLIIQDSAISSNFATTTPTAIGGGIYNSGSLVIQHSVVSSNVAKATGIDFITSAGGGIYNTNEASATIQFSAIVNNKAEAINGGYPASYGGGIYGGPMKSLIVANSTISGNSVYASGHYAYSYGGGVYAHPVTITDSTIYGNKSDASFDDGGSGCGGMCIGSGTITHSTIAGNWEGIVISGQLTLRNSIVAKNGGPNNSGRDIVGTLAGSGYNLIGKSTGGSGYVPSDILDVDPLLGPLAGNGGPTLTMALLPGSPAIDSGTNQGAPEWDQRGPGFPRIVNGTIDRGAFEVQSTGAPPANDLIALITAELETIKPKRRR
jgi:hypothetical protein